MLAAAIVVAVAVVGGAAAAAVVIASGGGDGKASTASTTPSTELVASAISLSYSGGRQVTMTCTHPRGAPCTPVEVGWLPLAVRCTAAGCTVTLFDQTIPVRSGAMPVNTNFHYEDSACGLVPVTGTLRAVGTTKTHGLARPVRFTGRVEVHVAAHIVPTVDCIGGDGVFVYNATSS